jgi:hypothetical protein
LGAVQVLVLDTDESRIDGSGGINLGSEQFDITLDPRPKKPGILSLRGPVHIYGTFRNADFRVTGQTIGRGVGAVALGIVNPLLALIPLIETGPGQNADCQAVLAPFAGALKQSGKKVADAPTADEKGSSPAPIVDRRKRSGPPAPIIDTAAKK